MQGFSLANIAISTPGQERMITWYTDMLGFRLVNKSEGVGGIKLALIEKDGVQMDLIQPPSIQPLPKPQDPPMHLETPGIRNLVFWVDNLKVANANLKSKKVPLLFESLYVEGIGTTITAFRDPDGNLVALWQKRNSQQ
jgi:catechol 2,3-dioxygenase-like lactoylglutathione lyase family enzyme